MAAENNRGGNLPKLEPGLNQAAKLQIVKPVHIGQSSFGTYYLYTVRDLESQETRSFFAPEEIHNIIAEKHLGVGSHFVLKRVQNGKNGTMKLELSIVGKASDAPSAVSGDNLKELLLQSIRDAVDIVKEAGVQFSSDELQKLATTLFIQRAR